jgi:hypothetical protein
MNACLGVKRKWSLSNLYVLVCIHSHLAHSANHTSAGCLLKFGQSSKVSLESWLIAQQELLGSVIETQNKMMRFFRTYGRWRKFRKGDIMIEESAATEEVRHNPKTLEAYCYAREVCVVPTQEQALDHHVVVAFQSSSYVTTERAVFTLSLFYADEQVMMIDRGVVEAVISSSGHETGSECITHPLLFTVFCYFLQSPSIIVHLRHCHCGLHNLHEDRTQQHYHACGSPIPDDDSLRSTVRVPMCMVQGRGCIIGLSNFLCSPLSVAFRARTDVSVRGGIYLLSFSVIFLRLH